LKQTNEEGQSAEVQHVCVQMGPLAVVIAVVRMVLVPQRRLWQSPSSRQGWPRASSDGAPSPSTPTSPLVSAGPSSPPSLPGGVWPGTHLPLPRSQLIPAGQTPSLAPAQV
jgi:hypothetical protein